jgi:hypothetical protein
MAYRIHRGFFFFDLYFCVKGHTAGVAPNLLQPNMPPPSANGQAGMLLQHINEYLSILPLVTVSTLVITVAFGLVDVILSILRTDGLVLWLDLSYPSIRHNFQGECLGGVLNLRTRRHKREHIGKASSIGTNRHNGLRLA